MALQLRKSKKVKHRDWNPRPAEISRKEITRTLLDMPRAGKLVIAAQEKLARPKHRGGAAKKRRQRARIAHMQSVTYRSIAAQSNRAGVIVPGINAPDPDKPLVKRTPVKRRGVSFR